VFDLCLCYILTVDLISRKDSLNVLEMLFFSQKYQVSIEILRVSNSVTNSRLKCILYTMFKCLVSLILETIYIVHSFLIILLLGDLSHLLYSVLYKH